MTPVASYRIQLGVDFTFDDAVGVMDQLERLGISHVYLSPVCEAVPGSTHGYDVVDHTVVRSELGGSHGLAELFAAAHSRGMSVIVDHVPNHVSVARPELQRHWWAMLRDGSESPSAQWFDVDWELTRGSVILPILGRPLEEMLAAGALAVDGECLVIDGQFRLPLTADTIEHRSNPDDLRLLLDQQHYRLMWWREPDRNLRRFFTIDDLAAVCVEVPAVADEVDALISQWCSMPGFGGLRVDHVDGLADPGSYLADLRTRIGSSRWLLVEKILGASETLVEHWPVDGTTGYEFIRVLDHLLVDPTAGDPLEQLWNSTDHAAPRGAVTFAEIENSSRREVLDGALRPDLERTVRAAERAVTEAGGSIESVALTAGLIELSVGLERYRTYLPEDSVGRQVLIDLASSVSARLPHLTEAVDLLVEQLMNPAGRASEQFRTRWQQLTGPAMAKGAEDRAFFRYHRLSSLCEVGGDPALFAGTIGDFHQHNTWVQQHRPTTLLAGSTHDTKRSEDVRARSAALSWHWADWISQAHDWLEALATPDSPSWSAVPAGSRLLALQTAVTCPGLDPDRLAAFLVKSEREADLRTSWTAPSQPYESALRALADELVGSGKRAEEIRIWAGRLDHACEELSVVATVLRATCPGVPDVYQGAERPRYLLVDPDNRRSPDWPLLAALIEAAGAIDLPAALNTNRALAKTVALRGALATRRRHLVAFGPQGSYRALSVAGADSVRVVAFIRGDEVVTVAALRPSAAGPMSSATTVELPAGRWRSVLAGGVELDGGEVSVTELLGAAPAALLELVR